MRRIILFCIYDTYSTLLKRELFLKIFRKFISMEFFFALKLILLFTESITIFYLSEYLLLSKERFFNGFSEIQNLLIDNAVFFMVIILVLILYLNLKEARRAAFEVINDKKNEAFSSFFSLKNESIKRAMFIKHSCLISFNNIFIFFPVLLSLYNFTFRNNRFVFLLCLLVYLFSLILLTYNYIRSIEWDFLANQKHYIPLLIGFMKTVIYIFIGWAGSSLLSEWLFSSPLLNDYFNLYLVKEWLIGVPMLKSKIIVNEFMNNNLLVFLIAGSFTMMLYSIFISFVLRNEYKVNKDYAINRTLKWLNFIPFNEVQKIFVLKVIRTANFEARIIHLFGNKSIWFCLGFLIGLSNSQPTGHVVSLLFLVVSSVYSYFGLLEYSFKFFPDLYEMSSEGAKIYFWLRNEKVFNLFIEKKVLFFFHILTINLISSALLFLFGNFKIYDLILLQCVILSFLMLIYSIYSLQKVIFLKTNTINPFELSEFQEVKIVNESTSLIILATLIPGICLPIIMLATKEITSVVFYTAQTGLPILLLAMDLLVILIIKKVSFKLKLDMEV